MNLTDALFSLAKKPHTLTEALFYRKLRGDGGGGSVVVDIDGNLPLTLDNAIEHKFLYLYRYGLCVQDGTPSINWSTGVASPVDIKCNSGVLCLVDSDLPKGYKRITGIKFDGDFWYNTGEVLYGDDAITMTLANTSSSGQNVFGSYNGTSSGKKNFSLYIYGGGSSNNCYYRYGEQLLRPKFGGNERTITISGNGTDGFATDVTATPETFVTEAPAYIGMLPNSSSASYTGSIIGSIDVVNKGELRLRWIPCERQSDGAIGYYDAIYRKFLEKTGSGTPVKGEYDTSHETTLGFDGEYEQIEVSNDNYDTQYAYVMPLLSAQERDYQDIISGEVTQRVEKRYFDGSETFTKGSYFVNGQTYQMFRFRFSNDELDIAPKIPQTPICTHFVGTSFPSMVSIPFVSIGWDNGYRAVTFYTNVKSSSAEVDFKSFVAEQYANGTPIILVYDLNSERIVQSDFSAVPLVTHEGTNVVDSNADISPIYAWVSYKATPQEEDSGE